MIRRASTALILLLVFAVIAALLVRVLLHDLMRLHPALSVFAVASAAVVFAALFYRTVLGRRAQLRRRTRALRWRTRLRFRPGPGYASLTELVFRWGRLAALSHGRRARPSLRLQHRLFRATTDFAWRLGRAQYFRRCWARLEDQTLTIAPQRTGKTGLLADRLLCHVGPAVSTSTRPDVYQLTAGRRVRGGYPWWLRRSPWLLPAPIYVWNPQNIQGLPSNFAWNMLEPCKDPVMARRMAGWLAHAVLGQNASLGNVEWFAKKGDTALGICLWAAAVSGHSVTDVFRWVQLDGHEELLHILGTHPESSPQMLAVVKRMLAENRTAASVRDSIELSLAWSAIPSLATAVTPGRGRGFDLQNFLALNGTVYLIASGDEDSPLAPLFAAFSSWIHYAAGKAGSDSPHGRLDPPLLMALDEVTTICPINLPVMLSDSAGKGVLIMPVAHSRSQLEEKWGEAGAKTVWNCCGTKVILGGSADTDLAEEVSVACGEVFLPAGDDEKPVRVVPPDFVRRVPSGWALVLRMELSPVVVKFRPAWKQLAYRLRLSLPVPDLTPLSPTAAAHDLDLNSTTPLELPELTETGSGPGEEAAPGFPFAGSMDRKSLN